jgi:hypothetical protein
MKPVSGIVRAAAAVVAVSVTFTLVWSMATLGYPNNADVSAQLAAAKSTRASQ